MWPSVQDWVSALCIIVPMYCTNGAPVIFGGGRPIDFGRTFTDGERIFGDHKTIRGFASGLVVGFVVGLFESQLLSADLFPVAILASLGALLGDLAGAFLKRRFKIKPGAPLLGVDQLDFVVGALLMVSIVFEISIGALAIMLLVTPPIHFLTNLGAYMLRLKSNYW
jgi:CDP-2,3-bis-(O-geranylgeranyl)-sn-glycerol synthase